MTQSVEAWRNVEWRSGVGSVMKDFVRKPYVPEIPVVGFSSKTLLDPESDRQNQQIPTYVDKLAHFDGYVLNEVSLRKHSVPEFLVSPITAGIHWQWRPFDTVALPQSVPEESNTR
eukprot:CAMPEP_0172151092 /NCGR_PEP_ID=MMETSP1050-20130122/27_1 /TAXON_ID=233186 /ORGANISM="Cryptomonas curvata, Strain CCAP979/52" /LENGTH=115 /DNA_ID=CAMNT_0012819139 /DNA_START=72 /DNA_END=419 /DNA_ORIENTATION=-